MSHRTATVLQVITALVGVGVFVFLLWEPHLEGRNADATLTKIYLGDPFLAFVYAGAIPFFVVIWQSVRLLGRLGPPGGDAERAAGAARLVTTCAGITIGFIGVGVAVLLLVGEERPPALLLGVLATLTVLCVSAPAVIVQRVSA